MRRLPYYSLLVILALQGCAAPAGETGPAPPRLVTVTHCLDPLGTFTIGDSRLTGVTAGGLPEALRKHQLDHAGDQYEVVAQMKSTHDAQGFVIAAFAKAGVQLVHYWVPVSDSNPEDIPGKYGPGFVDVMKTR